MPLILLSLILAAAVPAVDPATDEVNALNLLSGTRQVTAAGTLAPDHSAEALLDGLPERAWEPTKDDGRAAIFELAVPYDLSRIEVINSGVEAGWPGISVKQMKIETGPAPGGPWQPFAELALERTPKPQRFKASGRGVRYLRVSLTANYGNAKWYGLSELSIFGKPSEARAVDFNGVWETRYGEMVLVQSGQRIWGCYGEPKSKAGNATVDGSLEGRVFAGSWREVSPGLVREGTMVFSLTKEGGLAGVWGHGSDPKDRTSRWDGKPKDKVTITCEPPEKSLGQELAAKGRVVLRGILFDTGKDVIRGESEPVLKELAAAMKGAPEKTYLVEGHTDDRGGVEFNQGLSERRAASVKRWLEMAGVAGKLKTVGYGQSRPTAPNTTDGGRAANRRVEVATE